MGDTFRCAPRPAVLEHFLTTELVPLPLTFLHLGRFRLSSTAERQTLRYPLHTFLCRAPALLEKGLPPLDVDRVPSISCA